jgi:hypothetical protein
MRSPGTACRVLIVMLLFWMRAQRRDAGYTGSRSC